MCRCGDLPAFTALIAWRGVPVTQWEHGEDSGATMGAIAAPGARPVSGGEGSAGRVCRWTDHSEGYDVMPMVRNV